MEMCLYHPQHGYYMRGVNFTDLDSPKGRDFTTAPELTPLFGACVARWVGEEWERLGRPAPFNLVEVGGGRGALMRDVLDSLTPDCRRAAQVVMVEVSPALVGVQKATLANRPARWLEKVEGIGSGVTILLANEVLDAFPIRQWCGDTERMVVVKDGALAFSQPDDAVTREDSPAQEAWLHDLLAMKNLSALLVDYGSTTLAPETLQALRRHKKVSALDLPGEVDITAHVDFAKVISTLGEARCALHDLAPFLLEHGLLDAAAPDIEKPEVAGALQRLVHPQAMGALFKVLVFRAG